VTAGRATSGRTGRAIALRYRLLDNLSPKAKGVRIVIENRRGKRVRTIRRATADTSTWDRVQWTPQAKGTYCYSVYGKDLAGNAQRRVGSAKVVVR
jgi:hypothetical protein